MRGVYFCFMQVLVLSIFESHKQVSSNTAVTQDDLLIMNRSSRKLVTRIPCTIKNVKENGLTQSLTIFFYQSEYFSRQLKFYKVKIVIRDIFEDLLNNKKFLFYMQFAVIPYIVHLSMSGKAFSLHFTVKIIFRNKEMSSLNPITIIFERMHTNMQRIPTFLADMIKRWIFYQLLFAG